mgnify:CR=1 FL=1
MNLEKLTHKAQEALRDAVESARSAGNPELLPEHLLYALLAQEGGIVPAVLQKAGAPLQDLLTLTQKELERLPRASGGNDPAFSRRTRDVLQNAMAIAAKGGEEYTSTEHLLLGILAEGQGVAFDLLRTHGVDEACVLEAG